MAKIPFTQYLMPHGETKDIHLDCAEDLESVAQELIKRGCRFEVEVLSTGAVSVTCEDYSDDPNDPETLAIEIVANGPHMLGAVDKIITDAMAIKSTPAPERSKEARRN